MANGTLLGQGKFPVLHRLKETTVQASGEQGLGAGLCMDRVPAWQAEEAEKRLMPRGNWGFIFGGSCPSWKSRRGSLCSF